MGRSAEEIEDRLWSEIEKGRIGMLGLVGTHRHFHPMTAFVEKPEGLIWFFASREADLARHLGDGAEAIFIVQSKDQDMQASLGGRLTLAHDPERIDKFWSPLVEAWFPDGRDDPNLTLLRMQCFEAQVWLTETGPTKYAWEVARTSMTGERPDLADHRANAALH